MTPDKVEDVNGLVGDGTVVTLETPVLAAATGGGGCLSKQAFLDLLEDGYSYDELNALKSNQGMFLNETNKEIFVDATQEEGALTFSNVWQRNPLEKSGQGQRSGTNLRDGETRTWICPPLMTGQSLGHVINRGGGRLLPWPMNIWVRPSDTWTARSSISLQSVFTAHTSTKRGTQLESEVVPTQDQLGFKDQVTRLGWLLKSVFTRPNISFLQIKQLARSTTRAPIDKPAIPNVVFEPAELQEENPIGEEHAIVRVPLKSEEEAIDAVVWSFEGWTHS